MEETRGLRITTWNVNGIRNPFGYQPWRQERTFAAMFDILEADIVVMQETKIQRKDLRDDMVLVPGWDVFFSLPKHKKGYSGVAIYTRNSVCAPIRAEEGITGILTPPNSTTSFFDLPKDQQIGGYPSIRQLSDCPLDAATLDSEGRCVILEFPAFILIGTYCPANRDETRDEFRIGFLNALDARVRNLVRAGKRVFLTGDLNIIREELDTANAAEQLKKQAIMIEQFVSTPARRMLNQLLVGGKVIGEKDEGREKPVMWDICRAFHPDRKGMFTCWQQKINARPGNFGSRIDYVLCSEEWKDWFCESNIQEGLMGSDHCPVYAVLKDRVEVEGKQVYIKDIMSDGMFREGVQQRQWSAKDLLPTSAKLIPEFDRRRSIRDMFSKKPSLPKGETSFSTTNTQDSRNDSQDTPTEESSATNLDNAAASGRRSFSYAMTPIETKDEPQAANSGSMSQQATMKPPAPSDSPQKGIKRPLERSSSTTQPQKKGKASSSKTALAKGQAGKGQSSLKGFFKPKLPQVDGTSDDQAAASSKDFESTLSAASVAPSPAPSAAESFSEVSEASEDISPKRPFNIDDEKSVVDPIVSKESWSRLLGKRVVPRCEHNEPCISLVTKKPGVNCGRSFYMCPRPIGPSGQKEKNSQWRCGTFIWSSDWAGD
ncbi:related to APN2-AP endonuclease, exonuclease III homolog [Phialocephala subalpina]|uniref:DNA-(apurinic or apyrimidinic site) endonuclease 2 n=1 Tax=Phialocephala subalpina TaxID=576137 RepID=A0A1L7XGE8_9HELO|nr:related to APN2-AP endonuclease, exonuclease III homolog [Phialocephala subalpina]